jgi:hypothetical protein
VSPIPDETVSSYVQRLAKANKLPAFELIEHIAGSSRTGVRIGLDRLSLVSGVRLDTLRLAIPELWSVQGFTVPPLVGRPNPGNHQRVPCPKCVGLDREAAESISLWSRHEDVVCQRHWYWTDTTTAINATAHPELVRANRRHRRLIHRWGRHTVHHAYERALQICQDWYQAFSPDFEEHVAAYRRPPWTPANDETTAFTAAIYPTAVALTRLMSASHWRSLILDCQLSSDDEPERGLAVESRAGPLLLGGPSIDRYVAEVRRTTFSRFTWTPRPSYKRHPPFVEWVIDQLQEQRLPLEQRRLFWAQCRPDVLAASPER